MTPIQALAAATSVPAKSFNLGERGLLVALADTDCPRLVVGTGYGTESAPWPREPDSYEGE